jgi:energy-coupling factor transporter ATP-binding protein EcfA2
VSDGELTRTPITMSDARRTEHIAILGKTGSGKSSLLRSLCAQDIAHDRGFVYFDLHGDTTPFILRRVAEEEQRRRCDLSNRLIVIDPADREWSVGVNILGETKQDDSAFVRSAEFAGLLRHRWNLESLGARTEELLRNSLYVLGDNKLTLLELAPLLVNSTFRSLCVSRVTNPEIKEYFETRYDALSMGMQAVVREPILTKTSAFTADPRFRHIVGQQQSTFSISEAMQKGCWVVLNLHKGQLGEEAATLGSLFLSMIKYALFSRQSHVLFTLYCDEMQNLVSYDSGLDTILSEARKFGISVVSANQFLDQYPAKMRAAILAVGTHAFFQLASVDAPQIAAALDGGRTLGELLKNLPRGHLILKSGIDRWKEVRVPRVADPEVNYSDLYNRCRQRWAKKREDIEEQITKTHATISSSDKDSIVPETK